MTRDELATTTTTTHRNGSGALMIAGAVLFEMPVLLELVLPSQTSDGAVERPLLFGLTVATSAAGLALLAVGVRNVPASLRDTRGRRAGRMLSWVGAGLLALTSVAVLLTGLVADRPSDAVWPGWLLGMLLFTIGPVWWGLALRRSRRSLAWPLVGAGTAAFLSAAVGDVLWHDVALAAQAGCWVLAGLAVLSQGPSPAGARRGAAAGRSGRRAARAGR